MRRSDFLKSGLLALGGTWFPLRAVSARAYDSRTTVTVLYSNDTHSRVDPFPENATRNAGKGGMLRRAELIRRIRRDSPDTILLDAGDLLHGTSWFQLYGGRVEMELMDRMNYDAMCLGEHDLIRGVEAFADLAHNVSLPILCANYRFTGTPLASRVEPYRVISRGGLKFGVFGLGVRYFDYISDDLTEGLRYANPVFWAERLVRHLRDGHRCDYIICLSHLGHDPLSDRVDDTDLAQQVDGIDLIIGGHTHTFMERPKVFQRESGSRTLITQAGHSGLRLGRIDLVVSGDGRIEERIPAPYSV